MKVIARLKRRIGRAKAIWSELDYAQRRMFEIRTGIEVDARPPVARWPYFRH
jgi:hypothetical protein